MKKADVQMFFARLAAARPDAAIELEWTNPFTLLVAVVLSAQSTDIGVNKATRSLFKVVQTPQDMVNLGEDGLRPYIRTIGLFNTKGSNLIKLSQRLLVSYDGVEPDTLEDLQSLPGVGRKSANVVLNVAFGKPTIAVDTHVFRVSNRTRIAVGKTVRAVEDRLLKIVPQQFRSNAHHLLVLHGRHVCKARKPLCGKCVVYDLCPAFCHVEKNAI